ncbi:MAG: epoxyqueuosine reductase QueH [Fusobacteriaceae bacterium]
MENLKKENYENIMLDIIEDLKIKNITPTLLLHSCCAPCSAAVIEFLAQHFKLTVFFYNPNITDEEEYLKRKIEHLEYLKNNNLSIDFIDGDYCVDRDFFQPIKGLEKEPEGGKRCTICYSTRMEITAKKAKDLGFDYFSTVLSISPLKNSAKINHIGKLLEEKYSVNFLYSDFKKKNRYKRGIELSKENNLYRQDYCGCIFSKLEMEQKRKEKKL